MKWMVRAREKFGTPRGATDKTDITPLLSVMSVPVLGGSENFNPSAHPILGQGQNAGRLLRIVSGARLQTVADRRIHRGIERHVVDHNRINAEIDPAGTQEKPSPSP